MFLEQQIIILEWFLKDHVTLKTGVMMLKMNRNKNILKYIKIQNCYFKLQYYFTILPFYCNFDQINAALLNNISKPQTFEWTMIVLVKKICWHCFRICTPVSRQMLCIRADTFGKQLRLCLVAHSSQARPLAGTGVCWQVLYLRPRFGRWARSTLPGVFHLASRQGSPNNTCLQNTRPVEILVLAVIRGRSGGDDLSYPDENHSPAC